MDKRDSKTLSAKEKLADLNFVYENYAGKNIEEINTRFMNFLIAFTKHVINAETDKIPRECFNLISDFRIILGEIIGNGLKHGVNPACNIGTSDTDIVVMVTNKRTAEEEGINTNCGRGMTIIKEIIQEHHEIHIVHSHTEDAFTYTATLTISIEDLTKFINKYSTPRA